MGFDTSYKNVLRMSISSVTCIPTYDIVLTIVIKTITSLVVLNADLTDKYIYIDDDLIDNMIASSSPFSDR